MRRLALALLFLLTDCKPEGRLPILSGHRSVLLLAQGDAGRESYAFGAEVPDLRLATGGHTTMSAYFYDRDLLAERAMPEGPIMIPAHACTETAPPADAAESTDDVLAREWQPVDPAPPAALAVYCRNSCDRAHRITLTALQIQASAPLRWIAPFGLVGDALAESRGGEMFQIHADQMIEPIQGGEDLSAGAGVARFRTYVGHRDGRISIARSVDPNTVPPLLYLDPVPFETGPSDAEIIALDIPSARNDGIAWATTRGTIGGSPTSTQRSWSSSVAALGQGAVQISFADSDVWFSAQTSTLTRVRDGHLMRIDPPSPDPDPVWSAVRHPAGRLIVAGASRQPFLSDFRSSLYEMSPDGDRLDPILTGIRGAVLTIAEWGDGFVYAGVHVIGYVDRTLGPCAPILVPDTLDALAVLNPLTAYAGGTAPTQGPALYALHLETPP